MLDNEPPVNAGEGGGERDGIVSSPDSADSTTAPVRRTRAPRRKAAAAAAAPAEGVADPPGAEPGASIEAAAVEQPPVKKATRSRRKAVAPAAAADPDAAGPAAQEAAGPAVADAGTASGAVAGSDASAAPADGSDGSGPGEPVAPVKATRARRKKAAPAAAPAVPEAAPAPAGPAASAPAASAGSAEPEISASAGTVAGDSGATAGPAARSPRRARGTAKVTPAAAEPTPAPGPQTPADEEQPEESAAPIVGVIPLDADFVEEAPPPRRGRRAPALPPAVLFMPPDPTEATPVAPRRSRRGAAAASVPAAEATPVAPATPAVAEAAPEISEAEAAVADLPPAAEEPAEGTRRSRRRRRGAAEEPAEVAEIVTETEPVVDEVDETADDVEEGIDDESDDDDEAAGRRRRRRGRRGRGRGKGPTDEADDVAEEGAEASADEEAEDEESEEGEGDGVTRRRRRRRRKGSGGDETGGIEDGVHTVVRVREPRTRERSDEVQGVSGSTRLEAKRQRRRDGREQRRTRPPILSESEFLARREAVDRVMVVRQKPDRTQIAVLEDGILVEHYVARATSGTMVGNVYLGKVQNVLPSMEAAFVDVGRGRNAVLYAGEVNWDATGLEGRARSIEHALKSGDSVLVQVTKDPIGHKGARLSSHIALSGRHLVYVPNGNASGISRKLPDNERKRLRDVLKKLVPDGAGVIVRTAAEGASEDELARDVKRLQAQWEEIQRRAAEGHAPVALSEEPDLVIRVVRDLFNEDFRELVVQGEQAYGEVENYLNSVSPDLLERLHRHVGTGDVFAEQRIDEQILKALDRKVFLPSGGHLVIDRTEAMTVVDVNTGKYTGAGGNLEETVTRNNLEAAEEIVRQLRLRDLGGIVVIDFIDMVLESNRDLVLRRLTECLGRDRTKHQVTEITSLGLVQMTRKRIGSGLLEAFSENCDHCKGRGLVIHTEPVPERRGNGGNGGGNGGAASQVKAVAAAARTEPAQQQPQAAGKSRRRRGGGESAAAEPIVIEAAVVEPDVVEPDVVEPAVVEPVVADVPQLTEPPAVAPPVEEPEGPVAAAAEVPSAAGSGIITPGARPSAAPSSSDGDDEYDISGYDLSRYDMPAAEPEPMRLTGADDPDAADDDEDDDEPVGAATGRRRSRRGGGTRRRTRP